MAAPAVAVGDGCVWMTNWLGAAGLTVTGSVVVVGQRAAGDSERERPAYRVDQVGEVCDTGGRHHGGRTAQGAARTARKSDRHRAAIGCIHIAVTCRSC